MHTRVIPVGDRAGGGVTRCIDSRSDHKLGGHVASDSPHLYMSYSRYLDVHFDLAMMKEQTEVCFIFLGSHKIFSNVVTHGFRRVPVTFEQF